MIARYIALPVVSAGIIGGAALGMAGLANAPDRARSARGYQYSPTTTAAPRPSPRSRAGTTTTAWHRVEEPWSPGYHPLIQPRH